ncbi:sigma-70 family RNA polymerase sigma factor [Nocardiopsis sp. RSe5-2]|uniref:Sigma-70 family RNA polymerase sigma factor n=1 Tax=Nocardiopsis endophytica TaxID=3018445 RepID=A0ABT4U4Y3_9ACTN|nr:sigma-70 family RNA polymerase sigma factor [Nocardiopsis endophytica]MDA2812012.1 sigma-70 family RNA polymerase sigma factor [Nocardiopsis endophytica]
MARRPHTDDSDADAADTDEAGAPRAAAGTEDTARIRAVLALGGMPWSELDDGVQEVRLRLLQHRARPEGAPIRRPAAWLAAVASRVAVDWHRDRSRDAGLRDRLAARWTRGTAPGLEEDRVLALTVAEGLEGLSPPQRQVLVLRYYADLTVREIAQALDVPEGTVKSRLHAAAGALRSSLTREGME